MPKIIFDTNIYFSALGWDGKMLNMIEFCFQSVDFEIFSSPEIRSELSSKLKSARLAKLTNNKISSEFVINFLETVHKNSVVIKPKKKVSLCRDLKDDKFLELAKEIKADYLITGDLDVLEIKHFETIHILKPSEFIGAMRLKV